MTLKVVAMSFAASAEREEVGVRGQELGKMRWMAKKRSKAQKKGREKRRMNGRKKEERSK